MTLTIRTRYTNRCQLFFIILVKSARNARIFARPRSDASEQGASVAAAARNWGDSGIAKRKAC